MKTFFALWPLLGIAAAAGRTSAPSGALVVGGNGTYSTIQAAVDALSTSSSEEQIIFIHPGTYKEQVYIDSLSGPLTIYGSTSDTSSYGSNEVIITAGESQETQSNNDLTATLRVHTSGFKLYNVDVVNSYGKGSQALALSAYAEHQGYYACSFTGYQDTILAQIGAQIYAQCYIEGATDFIFGQEGQAWFEGCDIGVLEASQGYITASGRDSSSSASYYVINKSSVAAASGNTVSSGAYYLGRPWRQYARVAFQDTALSAVINSAGWSIWNSGDERTDNAVFGEYGNTGQGSEGTRAAFATKLSEPVGIADVLGSDYASAAYFDADYVG
ncbi:carbohydrate esterase family 8 protein [Pseudocercospora fijiensis CIRAD86]|uniref:Pectinesterase n=1 Tax=Pseudocercospora fijiensis (strain CIRAD86) TaxID=383855 RepID=N1QAK9_PSEFD|nr:carbohydrate esterase family 8 protein [Pseudocercospora fijiensis CIRAD86]EME88007.1 carbohydrate esterase family 8 protein [Pseudocercospora fijiensis CIRAD86]